MADSVSDAATSPHRSSGVKRTSWSWCKVLLREVDSQVSLIDELTRCCRDFRVQRLVKYSVPELLRRRIFAMGYQGINDHDSLGCDPMMAIGVGQTGPLRLDRDA